MQHTGQIRWPTTNHFPIGFYNTFDDFPITFQLLNTYQSLYQWSWCPNSAESWRLSPGICAIQPPSLLVRQTSQLVLIACGLCACLPQRTHLHLRSLSYHPVLEKQGTNSFTLLEQHLFVFCYNFVVFFYFLLFSMYTERLWLLKLRKPDSVAGVCVYKK